MIKPPNPIICILLHLFHTPITIVVEVPLPLCNQGKACTLLVISYNLTPIIALSQYHSRCLAKQVESYKLFTSELLYPKTFYFEDFYNVFLLDSHVIIQIRY